MIRATFLAILLPCMTCLGAEEPWWSCRPLVRPPVPQVDPSFGDHPIDRFLAVDMLESGLPPAPRADRATLLRRATYDLTGLPPSLQAIQAFSGTDSTVTWDQLVDELLASNQYGVKWGRHWLDLVRWAETDSFERDRTKPHAWRYRDWVVNAFNEDMPYDRFVLEQLAGDELEDRDLDSMIATGYYRLGIWDDEPTDVALAQYDDFDGILDTTSRVMLGLSMGCARCHAHKKDPVPHEEYYQMLAFFHGITPYKQTPGNSIDPKHFVRSIPDHIDDPSIDAAREITWRAEHDRLTRAISESHADVISAGQGPPVVLNGLIPETTEDTGKIDRPVEDDFTVCFRFRTDAAAVPDHGRHWWTGRGLVAAEVPGVANDWGISLHHDGRVVAGTGNPDISIASQGGYMDDRWHHVAMTRHRESGRVTLYIDGEPVADGTGGTESLDAPSSIWIGRIKEDAAPFEGSVEDVRFYDRELPHRVIVDLAMDLDPLPSAPGSPEHETLVESFMELRRPVIPTTDVLCVMEPDTTPPTTHVLARGNPHAPGDAVTPGFPTMLGGGTPANIEPTAETSGRRIALARWIVDPENIRTARVMVNRIWQHHFGRGIVPTPNDFGHLGLPPTHPELLDWLAAEYIERGWSTKDMHRLIMSSRAYQRSSRRPDGAEQIDPLNEAYTWFDMRRLTAEELRDSILQVNGTLNLQLGGPSVYPPIPEEVLATASRPDQAWGHSTPEQAARRSLYIHVKRSLLHPMLTSFDLADTDATCPVRFTTIQPTQALTMLNSDFINDQADQFARRLESEAGTSDRDLVVRGLQLALLREPEPSEIDSGIMLMEELRKEDGLSREDALKYYCLVLLNLNEFAYVD